MPPTHQPFDPELLDALNAMRDHHPTSITPEMIPEMRAIREGQSVPLGELSRYGEAEEVSVPGLDTGDPSVTLTIVRPRASGPALPAIYHCHGGGLLWGNSRTGLTGILGWTAIRPMVVVSVDYRVAPENPHPAPVSDCYAGLLWTAERATALGIDPARLLVAGASAGGGLPAALALLSRDKGGPALCGQMLMCPMLDDRQITHSSGELRGEGHCGAISNLTAWDALLPGMARGPEVSPYAAPARAADLSNLPPAFLDVGSVEVFRDEVVDYAARLWRAGTQAELHVWPGGWHGFDGLVPEARLSRAARAARAEWITRQLC